MQAVEIKKDIYWVGAIDWGVRDFHGYSTPEGTTYNAYLAIDNKIVLFDAVKKPYGKELLKNISQIVNPEKIDYIVVNHVEPDHSSGLPEILEAIKPEKIICSAAGKNALLSHYHREDWPYEVVKTGDTISLGSKTVRFIETKMVHWPDSMMSYIPEDKLLISQDGFGQHWASSERFDDEVDFSELMYQSKKYYANILLLYSSIISKLLDNIADMGLDIDMIAPDHGLIWRTNPSKIIDAYREWCQQKTIEKAIVVYDTMWQSTEQMARAIAHGIQNGGVSVKLMSLASCHRSDVMTELLDAKALVLGSSTLNNGMLPRMADVLCYIKGLRPANKIGAAFGSYGWGGEAVKQLTSFLEEMRFEIIGSGLKVNYVPSEDDIKQCVELGENVASAVLSSK